MKEDFYTPKFERADVVELTGVSPGTLANWLKRPIGKGGISITPEHIGGTGNRRLFSAFDLVKAQTVLHLVEFTGPALADELISSANFREWVNLSLEHRGSAETAPPEEHQKHFAIMYKHGGKFVVDYITSPALLDEFKRARESLPDAAKPYIHIPVGAIVDNVAQQVDLWEISRKAPGDRTQAERAILAMAKHRAKGAE
ncbi:hypothetical protein EOS93_15645 [Rhizobium sp. RMa-01]|uniref:hypothetical protein n=1 Tax=unclassified Rhizobium TaxID=2613769 RepID=UPI0008DB2CE8|nr:MULTISPECIES: hypothetical protein [unclassified Rhizobium]OHV26600.1 hypothetical protein BBJ66_00875 [Rhizobium sp. RSm-3]RVU10172.1 hypothetical protein EOS93_15645 [Rhizobium sp. RMa-01]